MISRVPGKPCSGKKIFTRGRGNKLFCTKEGTFKTNKEN